MKRSMLVLAVGLTLGVPATLLAKPVDSDPFQPFWDAIEEIQSQIRELSVAISEIELTPGPPGRQGEQGPRGEPSWDEARIRALEKAVADLGMMTWVKDANGKMVGSATRTGAGLAFVAITVGQYQPFVLFVERGYLSGEQDVLRLEDTNCAGTPLLTAKFMPWDPIWPYVFVGSPGMTVYINEANEPIWYQLSTSSEMSPDGTCVNTSRHINALPAIPVLNLSDHFTPPFHVEGGTLLP